MTTQEIIQKSFYDLYKKADENTDLETDLGLNEWGRNKLSLIIEMHLQILGYRSLTDDEIKSWKTMGNIYRTIVEVRGGN